MSADTLTLTIYYYFIII